MKHEDVLVGIDVGTSKVQVIVAQQEPEVEITNGNLNPVDFKILALSQVPSTGVKRGVIVNIDETVAAIAKAVKEAELMAGVNIHKAMVGVSGSHISGLNSSGVVGIKGKEITKGDIGRVIDAARAVAIPADRSSLHIIPQEFKVDDQDGIRDPMGMMGVRLEAKVHIVTAAQSALQNIIRCCSKTNLQVNKLVLAPLASAKAVLTKDERDLGVALVDIGAGTTDISIYHNGSIIHTCVIPLGGANISQDLAIGLRTPQDAAEKLKISEGCTLKTMIENSEAIEVPSIGGRPSRVIDKKIIGEIIEPRAEEILQLVNREIIASGCSELLGGGIVLTGGSTKLKGLLDLAEYIFDLPVKTAKPKIYPGLESDGNDPSMSTGIGLVMWEAEERNRLNRGSFTQFRQIYKAGEKFKEWVSELF